MTAHFGPLISPARIVPRHAEALQAKSPTNPSAQVPTMTDPLHRYYASQDGLRLHYLDYPGAASSLPLACLPGLTRPAEDFDTLARALNAQGRRVVAFDYRGRGDSQWDEDWSHYDMEVEQDDILRGLADAKIDEAAFFGTSRGGLHTMRLAKRYPPLVEAAVLNDIGPEIHVPGLVRIQRYVGKLPPLTSMADAIGLTKFTAGSSFSGVTAEQWETYARRSFAETPEGVVLRYDPELAHTLDGVAPDMIPEDFWPDFQVLADKPLLTIRGENSDILTQEILERMEEAAPDMWTLIVPGQGHAPLLMDALTLDRVADFLDDQE
jgi:pimeloyl-ACP methyl ester carboxylesterase